MASDQELQDLLQTDNDDRIRYSWDLDFQRHIVALLIVDRQFLLQCIDLVKPAYFTNKAHQKITQIVFEFFHKYKILPDKTCVLQELREHLKDDKVILAHIGEVHTLYDYFEPGLESREYLSDKITYFAKIQAIKKAFQDSLKLIDKSPENDETWSAVYNTLRDAMNTDRDFSEGSYYFQNVRERYNRMKDEEVASEVFITGFEGYDKCVKGGGHRRGEVLAVVGGSGVGKSVWLTCMAAGTLDVGRRFFTYPTNFLRIGSLKDLTLFLPDRMFMHYSITVKKFSQS